MKYSLKYLSFIVLCMVTLSINAQTFPQFTQYAYNTTIINPAYAGARESIAVTASSRWQWLGVQGNPNTQFLTLDTPLKSDLPIGVGISLINDAIGYEKSFGLNTDLSYTVKTSLYNKLSFGLKLGLSQFGLDNELLLDPSVIGDSRFVNTASFSSSWRFSTGVGLYYQTKSWYFGMSVPNLFMTRSLTTNVTFDNRPSYFFNTGFIHELRSGIKIKPTLLLKLLDGNPISFDTSVNFLFSDRYWLGVLYRLEDSLGLTSSLKLNDRFALGYTYEYAFFNLNQYTIGSHELLLKYTFKLRSKCHCPDF